MLVDLKVAVLDNLMVGKKEVNSDKILEELDLVHYLVELLDP